MELFSSTSAPVIAFPPGALTVPAISLRNLLRMIVFFDTAQQNFQEPDEIQTVYDQLIS